MDARASSPREIHVAPRAIVGAVAAIGTRLLSAAIPRGKCLRGTESDLLRPRVVADDRCPILHRLRAARL
jgi:hypothetical protein